MISRNRLEATGSNPVETLKNFFFSSYFAINCLNCDSLRWSDIHFICLIPAVHIISFWVKLQVCAQFMWSNLCNDDVPYLKQGPSPAVSAVHISETLLPIGPWSQITPCLSAHFDTLICLNRRR